MRYSYLTLTLASTAVAIHVIPGANQALQFERAALANGEWWRLLTAHLTHFGASHLAWDVAALVALGWLCERLSRARTAAALALAALAIGPVVWWWQPDFEVYRGLSGLDSALFGLLAGTFVLRRRAPLTRFIGAVALLGFGGKCAHELASQTPVFASGDDYAPAPLAHLVGLAAGLTVSSVHRGLSVFSAKPLNAPHTANRQGKRRRRMSSSPRDRSRRWRRLVRLFFAAGRLIHPSPRNGRQARQCAGNPDRSKEAAAGTPTRVQRSNSRDRATERRMLKAVP